MQQFFAGDDADEPIRLQFGRDGGQVFVRKHTAGEGQQISRARGQLGQSLRGALRRLALDFAAAAPAEDAADLGVQQSQVVDRFGGRRDRRPVGSGGALARDGQRGRQAVDPIGLGLLQPLQKLARIGRETLDVAALPFGIQRVQRQARLAAAADAAEHDQPAARQVQIDRLQIVNADAPQLDTRSGQFMLLIGALAAPFVAASKSAA